MLSKMERKGVVRHRTDGRRFVYRATVSREEVRRTMLGDLNERLFGGSVAAMVAHPLPRGMHFLQELMPAQLRLQIGLLLAERGDLLLHLAALSDQRPIPVPLRPHALQLLGQLALAVAQFGNRAAIAVPRPEAVQIVVDAAGQLHQKLSLRTERHAVQVPGHFVFGERGELL